MCGMTHHENLVKNGQWKEPLGYYQKRLEDVEEIEDLFDEKSATFGVERLCNSLAHIATLTRRRHEGVCGPVQVSRPNDDNPDTRVVLALWVKTLRLWWPSGWFEWLYADTSMSWTLRETSLVIGRDGSVSGVPDILPSLPHVPECVCVDAGVERGLCWTCEGDGWVPLPTRQRDCTRCDATGKCPRCSPPMSTPAQC